MTDRRLIVFYRALRPGQVKTRLAKKLGAPLAAEIYRALVLDLKRELEPFSGITAAYVDTCAGELLFPRSRLQQGGDLWDRMANAIEEVFQEGPRFAVLVGSDIPALTGWVLSQAFAVLADLARADPRGRAAVIGPAHDGGYYLLGFSREGYLREAVTCGREAEDRPAEAAVAALETRGVAVGKTTPLIDVDTVEDLRTALQSENSAAMAHLRDVVARHRLLPDNPVY